MEGALHPPGTLLCRHPEGEADEIYISARTGEGVDALLARIEGHA